MPNDLSTKPCDHYTEYAKFDADYGFAKRAGFQLSELQIKDVEQFVRWSASLNTYEVGGGKTTVSTVVSLMRGVQVTLVIMPPILLKSWETWLLKVSERVVLYRGSPQERAAMDLTSARWIVASLDIFRRDYGRIVTALHAKPHEMIVDECFTYKTMVTTEFGDLPIGEIAERKENLKVLSLNFSTGALEWKKVTNWFTKTPKTYLLRVNHANGNFDCTPSHKIRVGAVWKRADELAIGDELTTLDEGAGENCLRSLRPVLCCSCERQASLLQSVLQDEGSTGKSRVLQEVEGVHAKSMGKLPPEGCTKPSSVEANEREQSDEAPGEQGEDDNNATSDGAQACKAWRQREGANRASAKTCGGPRTDNGVRCKDQGCERCCRVSAKLLQAGLSAPWEQTRSGSRRSKSQHGESKTEGCKKDAGTRVSRVESVEVLEQRDYGESGSCGAGSTKVYDLEVEDNHNYFANGVVVSNCHNLKNPASVLFKKVQQASAGGYLQMLTGTPISKPLDAYAYIKLKTPNLYRNYTHFEATHVEERDFWKRPIRFGHLDLLKENLELQTISRTKKEIHGYDLTPIFPDTSYELSPEHQRLYNKLVDEQLLIFDDGTKIDATTGPALRHALQQVVVNFDHFSNNFENRSVAYDLIDQTIEETCCTQLDHSKLIIWTKYKMTSARVLAYCLKLGIKTVAAYSGSDSAAAAEAFMHDPETRILVANQQSAGAGLNPQYVCSEALYLEMDTVPIYNRQSIGRLDRVGQTVRPRMRIAVALGTVQVGLYHDMLKNDDMVERIEPSKDGLRKMLLGQV